MTRKISPAFLAYWAGSASASVMADYAAGNVTVIQAGQPSALEQEKTADALAQSLAHWKALCDRTAAIEERYPAGSYNSDCYPDGDE